MRTDAGAGVLTEGAVWGQVPFVGFLVATGLLLLFARDSLRMPPGLWFRWLAPSGYVLGLTSALSGWFVPMTTGGLCWITGMVLTRNWLVKHGPETRRHPLLWGRQLFPVSPGSRLRSRR